MKNFVLLVFFLMLIYIIPGCVITDKTGKSTNEDKIMNINQFINFAEQNTIEGQNINFFDKYFIDNDFLEKTNSLVVIILPGPMYIKLTQENPELKSGTYQVPSKCFWEVHFELKNGKIDSYHIVNSGINDNK